MSASENVYTWLLSKGFRKKIQPNPDSGGAFKQADWEENLSWR
jgi:hypothetical protein